MRTATVVLLLAVSFAANVSMGGEQLQGGCGLRCRQLRFIGEASIPVKPQWALLDIAVEVNSLQLQGGDSGSSTNSSGSTGSTGDLTAKAKQVRDEAHHRASFVLNYLKDLKMDEIQELQMQEMSFRPMEDDQDTLIGYRAIFGLNFKVKLDKLKEVLDSIMSESGANRVNSIVFVADKEDEQEANIKAIELATQDAWKQAQAVANVFGIQGQLKLLRVREKLQPFKRVLRRLAARRMDDNDDNDDYSMLSMLKGDTIINSRLVCTFDFDDGTINFQEVAPVMNNFTVSDSFGGLLKEGGEKPKDETKPAVTNTTTATNNATVP